MSQCCCGRLRPFDDVLILNGIKHELFGPKGAMCAPVQACELRDVRIERDAYREALEQIAAPWVLARLPSQGRQDIARAALGRFLHELPGGE